MANQPPKSSDDTWVDLSSSGYDISLQAKSSSGFLRSVDIFNSKASAQFYQIHDSASAVAEGTVPKEILYVNALSNGSFDYPDGVPFNRGIYICNSSSGPTKISGAADSFFFARFR